MKSTDGGFVWTKCDTNYYIAHGALTNDPNNDAVFWSGGCHDTSGVWVMVVSKTTDTGASWTRYVLSSIEGLTYAIAVDPISSDIVYAGGYDTGGTALFKTTDGGENWMDVSSGLSGSVQALAIDPESTHIIYAGTENGVFRSLDGGAKWTQQNALPISCLLIDPISPNTIFAGTKNNGVYMSTNGGDDWQEFNDGLDTTTAITRLGIHPGLYVYAGTYGAGLYRREHIVGIEDTTEASNRSRVFTILPNPARSTAEIAYTLTGSKRVTISIYDVQGRLVQILVDETQQAGVHESTWHGVDQENKSVSSGIYFCRLSIGTQEFVKKVILVR